MRVTRQWHVTPRRVLRWFMASAVLGACLMAIAGQWSSIHLWAFTAAMSLLLAYGVFLVIDDGLARERFRPGAKGADDVALRWIRVSALAALVLAPLDSGRLHWSEVDPVVRWVAFPAALFGFWLVIRAMEVNRFFSAVVRIQDDRGHVVVDKGPYGVVRHPGYVGMLLFAPAATIVLGSWWALVPAGIYAGLIVRRVFAEDDFLRRNLAGYDAYQRRVRYRMIPGLY